MSCLGSICTNWVIRNSPWPLLQFGFVAHAITTWNPKTYQPDKFSQQFWINFFRLPTDDSINRALQKIGDFFPTLGTIGEPFNDLINKMTNSTKVSGDSISKEEVMQILSEKLPLYEEGLLSLESKINNHEDLFEFILNILRLVQISCEIAVNIHPIQQLAIDFDEQVERKLPSPEELNQIGDKVKELVPKLDPVKSSLTQYFESIMESHEVEVQLNRLSAPILTLVDGILQPFIDFTGNLKVFVDNVAKFSMKNLGKNK
jgi:hypothetical protein